jgi:hypothetical protein
MYQSPDGTAAETATFSTIGLHHELNQKEGDCSDCGTSRSKAHDNCPSESNDARIFPQESTANATSPFELDGMLDYDNCFDEDPGVGDDSSHGEHTSGPDQSNPTMTADNWLLKKYQLFCQGSFGGRLPMDKGMRVQTKLMKIISKANAPLYLVMDEVQDWAYDASTEDEFDFGNAGTRLKGRKAYLKSLFTRYGLEDIQPKAVDVILPSSKVDVEMAIFDIKPGIYSLLTSPSLMQDKNLNFPNNDPFGVPSDSPEMHSDIQSGSRFRNASKSTCRPGTSDVPLPDH